MASLKLVVGTKNLSSWSLRAWLVLRQSGLAFDEVLIELDRPDSLRMKQRWAPHGKVPVLHDGNLVVWESLAIAEFVAEKAPQARLWPVGTTARAIARSVSNEMHAGFVELRRNLPMNIKGQDPQRARTEGTRHDIRRILELWRDCRTRFGADGPFLFGQFTIADAMYAPIVTRFRTYGVDCDAVGKAYCEAVWSLSALREWVAAC